jgi:hypothetical protein
MPAKTDTPGHCNWLDCATNPRPFETLRLPVTTVSELTGIRSSLTTATDAPGHCHWRDRATSPRRLRSARLPVTTVTELTGIRSSLTAATDAPGHCHWLDCATNPNPSERCHLSLRSVTETKQWNGPSLLYPSRQWRERSSFQFSFHSNVYEANLHYRALRSFTSIKMHKHVLFNKRG